MSGQALRFHKRLAAAAAVSVMLLAAGACSGAGGLKPAAAQPSGAAGSSVTTDKPQQAVSDTPVQPQGFFYPLTGLPAEKEVTGRPIAVMVENSPAARPQTGLAQADLVYEALAEGDITRFMAYYQSRSPKVIGPVRSIRPYYVELGSALDAVIVHAGWSQDAMDAMVSLKVDHLDQVYGDDKYYWRDGSRKMPHNLYTSIDRIRQGAANKKFHPEWKSQSYAYRTSGQDTVVAGDLAGLVRIPYIGNYVVEYRYDEAAHQYTRYMNGKPHADKETEETIKAANVLIIESDHRIVDKEGRRVVDVKGPGHGTLFTDGRAAAIVWERKNGLIRAYVNGVEAKLSPGPTWVQIVPKGTAYKYEKGAGS